MDAANLEAMLRAMDGDMPGLPEILGKRGPSPEDLKAMKADREGYLRFMDAMVEEADVVAKALAKMIKDGPHDLRVVELQIKISMWRAAAKAKWIHPVLLPVPGGMRA